METSLDRYCFDLPSTPKTSLKILVTGGTGYIGGELIPELVARGYQVRIMVRKYLPTHKLRWPTAEIVIGDALNYESLVEALKGIDCAYYLIHSLHVDSDFKSIDSEAAVNFRKAAELNQVQRIIYLGSLGVPGVNLSKHLSSRIKVGEDLKAGKTPVTFLRAAVIIGSGSASYKMIHHLIRKWPVFLFPKMANSKCQPIAIRDVIKYLVGCLENEATSGKTFDIGGVDVLTYKKMLQLEAIVVKKRRFFIASNFFPVNIYARITSWLVPIPRNLISALLESCNNEVICLNKDIQQYIPFEPINYIEALERARLRDSQHLIFEKTQAAIVELKHHTTDIGVVSPPAKSSGFFSDVRYFLGHKPDVPTEIHFNSKKEKEDYSYRILQRLGIHVEAYKILNIHKIGVEAPAKYVFEELLQWDGDSTCWPNHIAKVVKQNNSLESLFIYLFGWTKAPNWIKNSFIGRSLLPLFKMNSIRIKKIPDASDIDNARFLLYKCSGGYPIGIFTMYVRTSIERQEEKEQSQLFLVVGFNFYGKEKITKMNVFNRMWESVHNRVTSNILNRIKQLSEWRFEKIQSG